MPLRQNKKSPERGKFRTVFDWTEYRADVVRMRPNRGASRGDRGGVRGFCGVVLSYNFLPESKTYILAREAFHLHEPGDVGMRISQ